MTDFDTQDDILEDWQDEGRPDLTQEERKSREKAFQAAVDARIKQLLKPKSYKAETRREAARWLGESGEIQAIEALVKVYEKDSTPGMKEAAAYALGQFRALENALDDPDESDKALQNLENIVLYREMGSRHQKPNRGLQLGLGILLMILVLVGVGINISGIAREEAVPTLIAADALPTPTPDTLEWQQERLRDFYIALRDDTDTLRAEFQEVSRPDGRGGQDCTIRFNNPDSVTLSPVAQSNPALPDIAEQLNEVNENLTIAREAFRQACAEGRALTRDEVINEYGDEINAAQRGLADVLPLLEEGNITIPPTDAPDDTPQSAPTPEATVDPQVLNTHVRTLEQIINDMTAQRGAASRVQTYWNDVESSGSSGGCNQIKEQIPPNYDVPDEITERLPELERAEESVNLGLELTRRSQDAFFAACEDNTLTQVVGQQQDLITTAIEGFNNAQQNLDNLRATDS
jgi:hypothetical protein